LRRDAAAGAILVVPQPKWWDKLPLLPFLIVCSYLPYGQVFCRLPCVCKHFNELFSHNQVTFQTNISLGSHEISPLDYKKKRHGTEVITVCTSTLMYGSLARTRTMASYIRMWFIFRRYTVYVLSGFLCIWENWAGKFPDAKYYLWSS
jgi:hypothetical protein